jgi:hypothetical protein
MWHDEDRYRLRVEFTKSRPRHCNHNALEQTKNAVRKHFGYAHLPQRFAAEINAFCLGNAQRFLKPGITLEGPCTQALALSDNEGRRAAQTRRAAAVPLHAPAVPQRRPTCGQRQRGQDLNATSSNPPQGWPMAPSNPGRFSPERLSGLPQARPGLRHRAHTVEKKIAKSASEIGHGLTRQRCGAQHGMGLDILP